MRARLVLTALLAVGACGQPATRVRIEPPASRVSITRGFGWTEDNAPQAVITERPVAFDLSAAEARDVVTTQRASRDYRRSDNRTKSFSGNVTPGGDAKAFIYNHESGNNPARHNAAGCRGLGQACPGSKLPCSDTDYACQDNWFTYAYMVPRYGTWEAAEAHWISRAHRCGTDWCGGSW